MGIRLWKKLGWGITGLEHDMQTGALTDPRINADALIQHPESVGPHYLEYLKARLDAERRPGEDVEQGEEWFDLAMTIAMVEAATEDGDDLPFPVTRESEAGRRDLLLIQPVGYSQWSRYADRIDHAEEGALHPDDPHRVVPMPHGIYPFEGLYMDSRDGRRLDTTAKRLIDKLATKWDGDDGEKYRKAADHLARVSGFEDSDQALEHMAPVVPPDIRYVISWLNLFNGPDVWLQLRPMLYVYWS